MPWPSRSVLWLLLLTGLLLLLMGASVPAYGSVRTSTASLLTQGSNRELKQGIQAFKAKFGVYPPQFTNLEYDVTLETNGTWLDALLGIQGKNNPNAVTFIEPRMAGKRGDGLIGEPGKFSILDCWKHPYWVILDTNGDGRLDNPDLKNSDPLVRSTATPTLAETILVFSAGPDGLPFSADDIPTWRTPPHLPVKPSAMERFVLPTLLAVGLVLIIYSVTGLIVTRNDNWNRAWPY